MQDSLLRQRDTLLLLPHRARVLSHRSGTIVYGSELIIVRIIVVAISVVVVVDVGSCSSFGGGGVGSSLPGECMIPAKAETASVRLRATTAPVRRNLFT